MIVTPSFQKPKPIALVTAGYRSLRVQTVDADTAHPGSQARAVLGALKGHVVYCRGLMNLVHVTGASEWQATAWKGRAVSMVLDGTSTTILSLRNALGECTTEEAFDGLLVASAWLADHGVSMGSLSSVAWHLWCATLESPVTMATLPALGHAAFYGPRQEVREPRTYHHMAVVDTANAYPAAMAARPYAMTLREVSRATTLDPSRAGLARASVTVPSGMPFTALPTRVADSVIQWRSGELHGVWTWNELDSARGLGCDIRVERCFAPMSEAQPFGGWFALLAEGRALPGPAGRFLKRCGTALWGMFAMTGDHTAHVRFLDHEGLQPVVIARPQRRLPQAATAHIAAETSARVRTSTLREIYALDAWPVHVDTDGVIVRRSAARAYPTTCAPGEWRRKQDMVKLEVRAPQLYRYKCPQKCCFGTASAWHYVAAGMNTAQAAELFDRCSHPSRIGILDRDCVLPPIHSSEVARNDDYLREAQMLRTALFGVGLA